jgi:hypothetical protein
MVSWSPGIAGEVSPGGVPVVVHACPGFWSVGWCQLRCSDVVVVVVPADQSVTAKLKIDPLWPLQDAVEVKFIRPLA